MKHGPCGILRSLRPVAAQARCTRACCRACERAVVGVALAGALLTAILGLGLHVNLSPSAPRAVPRRHGNPHSGGVGGASVSPGAAALGRARGYLGPGAGGVQAVIKPVVALAGDVGGVRAGGGNRQRSAPPGSSSADIDSLGLPLPHAVWGRHVVAADEFWLVSTRVPNSWDSRIMPEAVELDRRTSAAFRSFRNSRWPRLFAWSGSPSVSRLR